MKLISMTSFVMMQNINFANKDIDINQLALRNLLYAQLLTQPLTLGMFVPCDEDGNVLKKPFIATVKDDGHGEPTYTEEWEQYQQAKERVLFESVSLPDAKDFIRFRNNIEGLVNLHLTLTPTAIKQIGL